jgi:1-acyl-sn-glycerol-3-phosphate acyltransferase
VFAGPRHPISVRFGPPLRPREGEHRTELMERIRLFFEESGAVTTPDPRIEARGGSKAS